MTIDHSVQSGREHNFRVRTAIWRMKHAGPNIARKYGRDLLAINEHGRVVFNGENPDRLYREAYRNGNGIVAVGTYDDLMTRLYTLQRRRLM